ncbi:hypothetical protein AVEN_120644-1, partial [Araneus ventricosus]
SNRDVRILLCRGGLVVKSRLRGRRVPGSKPDSTKDPPCMEPVISNGQPSFRWCGVEVWRREGRSSGSSSPSDRGRKLRGEFQNSPCVASKCEAIITKLVN